jgi:fused signal recognition particle receptor
VFWKKKSKPESDSPASTNPTPETPAAASSNELDSQESSQRPSWLSRLRGALSKTSRALNTDIRDLWKSEGQLVDDDFLQNLFAILVRSDMGGPAATQIRDRIAHDFRARRVELSEILAIIKSEIRDLMQAGKSSLNFADSGPTVILVVGVNGSGKTTSIAKLAYRFRQQGKRVILGAGDTFRAAAVQQLKIWSERIGCDIVLGDQGGDPGAVAFRAAARAKEEGFDICILDTAGRLQTQVNLMQQLDKIRRVVTKQIDGAPHEVLLVIDATAGQNALSQAKGFSEAAGCTGIILAKLDGSAKGGVVIPILKQFGLPVKFVGLGEQLDDLGEFDPDEFSDGLFADNDR